MNPSGKTTVYVSLILLVTVAFLLRVRGSPVLFQRNVPEDASLGMSHAGVHSCHIGGVAVVDFLFTVVLAGVLSAISKGPFTFWLILVLLIAEAMHYSFGIRTATQKWLFGMH